MNSTLDSNHFGKKKMSANYKVKEVLQLSTTRIAAPSSLLPSPIDAMTQITKKIGIQ